MRRSGWLMLIVFLAACGGTPVTPTPEPPPTPPAPPAPMVTRVSQATSTRVSTPASSPIPRSTPTDIPLPVTLPTVAPEVQAYARELTTAMQRIGGYLGAMAQACAGFDLGACQRAYDANWPLYEQEVARIEALTPPAQCTAARDRFTDYATTSGKLFTDVAAGLRGQTDPFTFARTVANDFSASTQALQALAAELANGSCR